MGRTEERELEEVKLRMDSDLSVIVSEGVFMRRDLKKKSDRGG